MNWPKFFAAPVAAIVSSLASLSCCLPLGILAFAGAAGAAAYLQTLSPWLLGVSVVFLVLGFAQLYRARRSPAKPSAFGIVLLLIASALVLAIIIFPQEIAGLLADRLNWSYK